VHAGAALASVLDAVEHGEIVVITRDGIPVGRLSPDRLTTADRLKAALREHPADLGFADDLASVNADLRAAFTDQAHTWPGE
jgi:antitoxin (DNA-binding transcriptional repressor) of toxin-antitoxin stability system